MDCSTKSSGPGGNVDAGGRMGRRRKYNLKMIVFSLFALLAVCSLGFASPPGSALVTSAPSSGEIYRGALFISLAAAGISAILISVFLHENKKLRRTQQELVRSKAELFESAYKDSLTGLPNRSHFFNTLAEIAKEIRVDGEPILQGTGTPVEEVAVVYVDIDDFKLINEARGHQNGDRLLKMIARDLVAIAAGEEDVYVARIGGDEFVAMVQNPMSRKFTEDLAAKIQDVFCKKYCIDECNIYPTASIGIARFPQDTTNIFDLVINADMALYEAKKDGKNRYAFYNPTMNEIMKETTHIQNMVPDALLNGQFFLLYQPQIDYAKHKLIGYEALLRWMVPDEGIIMPAQFIPIIEKSGQILPVGKWVLETACIFAKRINENAEEPIIISVNISPVQLIQKDFFDSLVDIIGKTNVRPSWIGLEITETTLITSLKQNADVLSLLQQMGFHVYLDDFGTGYSSIHYLRELPIETVKIDQTFVNAVGESDDDDDLLRLIIHVAHLLKINVMAEGVETVEQLDFLEENNCDTCQGYLFGMPITEEEVFSGQGYPDLRYRR
jgi:diguanylate cyclase (GGDEF)-like protein